jgi:hypothetical protein
VAFRADFKLPFTLSTLYGGSAPAFVLAPVAQLALGLQYGRIGLGIGLGFTHYETTSPASSGSGAASTSTSGTEVMIVPTLTCDMFRSTDGKVALYLLGAPIFGDVVVTNRASLSDLGFQFALGTNIALHDSFRLGIEAGPVAHFYAGESGVTSLSTVSIYTALVGSFVFPR